MKKALFTLLVLTGAAWASDTIMVKFNSLTSYQTISYTRAGVTKTSLAGEFNLTVDGTSSSGYCVDLDHTINTGAYYEAELVEMPAEAPYCEIGYILANYDATDSTMSASIQSAIWELIYDAQGQNFTINSPSTVKTNAEAMQAEAQGMCPISCEETVELNYTLTDASDGYVHGYIDAIHGTGYPVAGQEVYVTVSNGTLIYPTSGVGVTDENGMIDVTVEIEDAETVTIDYSMDGRTLYSLVPTASIQQLLAFQIEECTWADTDTFTVASFGDPKTIGFWKHNFGVATGNNGGKAQIDASVLESYLSFNVLGTDLDTLDDVYSLLNLKKATMEERAVQQCTATMLNLKAGEYSWLTLVDGIEFWEQWAEVEALYADGDYEGAKDICDGINNL